MHAKRSSQPVKQMRQTVRLATAVAPLHLLFVGNSVPRMKRVQDTPSVIESHSVQEEMTGDGRTFMGWTERLLDRRRRRRRSHVNRPHVERLEFKRRDSRSTQVSIYSLEAGISSPYAWRISEVWVGINGQAPTPPRSHRDGPPRSSNRNDNVHLKVVFQLYQQLVRRR